MVMGSFETVDDALLGLRLLAHHDNMNNSGATVRENFHKLLRSTVCLVSRMKKFRVRSSNVSSVILSTITKEVKCVQHPRAGNIQNNEHLQCSEDSPFHQR